jgi:hypothetical protein
VFRTALIYDFDGTLSPGAMQQHTLIPALGFGNASEFWDEVKRRNRDVDGDEILTYMHYLIEPADHRITASTLREHGKDLPFFSGVEDWFVRINEYGAQRGLDIEHYIISSGLREMIEGSPIYPEFRHVFASSGLTPTFGTHGFGQR